MTDGEPVHKGVWEEAHVQLYIESCRLRHGPDVSRAEALAAVALAGRRPGDDVLDCPCGFGRHSIPLAAAGYRLVGLDGSELMLREARRRAAASDRLVWLRGDYRSLPFQDAAFDAVLNLYTSIGFTGEDDDRRGLREFRRVLRPGGRLVLDVTHRDLLMTGRKLTRHWELSDEGDLLLEESRYDLVTGWLWSRHVRIASTGVRQNADSRIRVYSVTELAAMLRAAGFERLDCLGGLNGRRLGADTRLVVVATAPGP